jgi:hypothetical protein
MLTLLKRVRVFIILFFIVFFGGISEGCSIKTHPAALDINYSGDSKSRAVSQSRRKRIAKSARRKQERLERKTSKPLEKAKRDGEKARKRMVKAHIDKQLPEVKKRMLENQKYTEDKYRERKLLKKFLTFWKKKKYKRHGS